jgi:hypothetical protein
MEPSLDNFQSYHLNKYHSDTSLFQQRYNLDSSTKHPYMDVAKPYRESKQILACCRSTESTGILSNMHP